MVADIAKLSVGREEYYTRELAADHLPPLIRKSGWKWNGNYFDPAIPRGVELHFQLWDSDFELISIQTLDKVWERSCFGSG